MLGELLIKSGVITAEQLAQALEEEAHSRKKLGEVLEAMGLISPEILSVKLREQQESLPPKA